jgi:hypothetical protein
MSLPETKVYIAFFLSASGDDFFTLNDSTKGLLNSVYGLGGLVPVFTDVTEYVASVSVNRGKSRELDRYTAGNANVLLHNDSRIFDPFNEAGIYYGNIAPRKRIIIETNGIRSFSGFIDDWDFTYEISGKSFATVSALDGFMLLSAAELDTFTTISQLSSDRINVILNRPEVNWADANRSIETGFTTLQADIVPQTFNALGYLQLVEQTENGMLFMNRSGLVTFKNRGTRPDSTAIIFADDSTVGAIRYTNIGVIYGSENLYNRVTVTRLNGLEQTADSTASQTAYGIASINLDGLLLTTDTEALALANYLVGLYDEPELRISEITVNLHDKTSEEISKLISSEIGDTVQVRFTPNQIGSAIAQNAIIIGIAQSIEIDQHKVTYTLATIESYSFILDDLTYGLLDSGLLAY